MSANEFVHLHVHSQYSLLDGVSHFGPLFEQVKTLGMNTVALTDHGNLFGACAFFQEAQNSGVKPIIGCEVYVSPTRHDDRTSNEAKVGKNLHLVLLAKDYQGYLNLCYLVSKGYLDGFYRRPRIDKELLAQKKDGLIALSACLSGVLAEYFRTGREKQAYAEADDYAQIMGPDHFYVEMMDHGLPEQKTVNQHLLDLAKKTGLPLVATNDSHYLHRRDAKSQDLLIAIGTGKTLEEQNRFHFACDEFYLKSPAEMGQLFGHIDGAISNTVAIAERCNPEIRFRQSLLPEYKPPNGDTPEAYLRHLVLDGLRHRFGEISDAVQKRYDHEMTIITSMGFVSYFLVVWDFVNFARDKGIPTGCRGSGAGSLVAYALGITELDPIKSKLFFERFLNPERVSMPDFDIDICQVRRPEVIEYVRDKYGSDCVAHIITFGKMLAKQAVRDVGRVLNMPLGNVDAVAKMIPEGPKVTIQKALDESSELKQLYEADPKVKDLIDRARAIEGTVRQPGMHAAGVVVCSKPLIEAVPLYRQAGKEEVITQYNMIEVEELGLLKIDFLGLKNLTIIADCLQIIQKIHGLDIEWEKIGFEDAKTFGVLQRGDGFGVFQVESSGMREMLRRALPSNFEDIVALIALYRPGPLQFMDSFINRKHGREPITYPHPLLEDALKETYGLMIYQEQVMQVASVLAGFSLGQADILRRAMSKKKEKEMAQMRALFVEGAAKKDISEKIADEVFAMIEKFASYGFNKAHAASYAVLTFRTAYLKAHYPAEFMAALLTGEIRQGASDKLGIYIGVAREMGLRVLQPDINLSQALFSVVKGNIRFGLAAIKNVGHAAVDHIVEVREKDGPFQSFQEYCERIDSSKINARAIECLIRAGGFDSLDGTRPQKLAVLPDALEMGSAERRMRDSGQMSLFDGLGDATTGETINALAFPDIPDWTQREKLEAEKELAGFFLSGHPLDRFRPDILSFSKTTTSAMSDLKDGDTAEIVGVVTQLRKIMDKRNQAMAFVEIEDFEGKTEAICFARVFEQVEDILFPDSVVFLKGRVSRRPDDETGKILVDEVVPVEALRRSRAKFLDITLPALEVEDRHLENLRGLFRNHRGPMPVRLRLDCGDEGELVLVADSRFKIAPSDEFLKEFDRLDLPASGVRFAEG
jgi:DNA polymerase-3 subunit alpha